MSAHIRASHAHHSHYHCARTSITGSPPHSTTQLRLKERDFPEESKGRLTGTAWMDTHHDHACSSGCPHRSLVAYWCSRSWQQWMCACKPRMVLTLMCMRGGVRACMHVCRMPAPEGDQARPTTTMQAAESSLPALPRRITTPSLLSILNCKSINVEPHREQAVQAAIHMEFDRHAWPADPYTAYSLDLLSAPAALDGAGRASVWWV